MTDKEIHQSKLEHIIYKLWLQRLVCAGAPSRLGWVFNAYGQCLGLWDFANERPYRKPRKRRA